MGAHEVGDPQRGKNVFLQCSACHSLNAGEHRIGPSLHGIVGRTSGTAKGFGLYSDAMKRAGITWDADNLKRYLTAPQAFIAGTSMLFFGVKDEGQLDDLIAYLLKAAATN
ncbi:MAG: c-type cytochrome [Gammaproteobacteria bacterium]